MFHLFHPKQFLINMQLEINGVQPTSSKAGLHNNLLKHAPMLNKQDQEKLLTDETYNFQMLKRTPKVEVPSIISSSVNNGLQKPVKCARHAHCIRAVYKDLLCKKHFLDLIRANLRSLLKSLYRNPPLAYSAIDPDGKGYITREDFMQCQAVKRLTGGKSLQDVMDYIKRDNLFKDGQMDIDEFKRIFFPQYAQVERDEGSDTEQPKPAGEPSDEENGDPLKDKLARLEQLMKDKFANNWTSVRKAFLDLDTDYDGYVTVEDFLRLFGKDEMDFKDLTKIITDKDQKRQGKINYTDFSKWMGGEIQKSEGFYFRHDSKRNPQYEKNIKEINTRYEQLNKRVILDQIEQMNLEQTVLEKIKFQWKTLKKAFSDLNQEKSGAIKPLELQHYLDNWGLILTDAQFQRLFAHFDHDRDGKISYEDFQNSAGNEINPMEFLYFRQDINKAGKQKQCKHKNCWYPPQGFSVFCKVHLKMTRERGTQILAQISEKMNGQWQSFLLRVSKEVDPDDQNLIEFSRFMSILEDFHVPLSDVDRGTLLHSFLASPSATAPLVNLSALYSIRLLAPLRAHYDRLDLYPEADNPNLVDTSGYLGLFYRGEKRQMLPMGENELVEVIARENRLPGIWRVIREIDKDNNGYVTNQEIDDIFKINYEKELGNREIKGIFKKFASIQNRILIDYKKVKEHITKKVKELTEAEKNIKMFLQENDLAGLSRQEDGVASTKAKSISSRASVIGDRLSSASMMSRRKLSQPAGLKMMPEPIAEVNEDVVKLPNPLSKSVLLDKSNLDKLRRQTAINESAPPIKRAVSRCGESSLFKRFQTPGSTKNALKSEYSTASLFVRNQENRFLDQIRQKLAYEWKNIFRNLHLQDLECEGKVNKTIFQRVIHECKSFITREELNFIQKKYAVGDDMIDYAQLSKEMGLHSNTLNLVANSTYHKLLNHHPQIDGASSLVKRKKSQDYHSAVGTQRALSSMNIKKRPAMIRPSSQMAKMLLIEDEDPITRVLMLNIEAIKTRLKEADKERKGTVKETEIKEIMAKYGIKEVNNLDRFKKQQSDLIDYIQFLKYYL